jgi:hypothetical protein
MTAIINASTSSGIVQTADTSGTLALQSNGTTQFTVSSTGAYGQLKSATAQASTSGTSIDFTSIPSWVKRITVMFNGVSTNGTSLVLVQIGAGSVTTSGYVAYVQSSGAGQSSTAGFVIDTTGNAAYTRSGVLSVANITGNTWVSGGTIGATGSFVGGSVGNVSLSGTLDRIRITTVNGTDTFDAGSINILYEG